MHGQCCVCLGTWFWHNVKEGLGRQRQDTRSPMWKLSQQIRGQMMETRMKEGGRNWKERHKQAFGVKKQACRGAEAWRRCMDTEHWQEIWTEE